MEQKHLDASPLLDGRPGSESRGDRDALTRALEHPILPGHCGRRKGRAARCDALWCDGGGRERQLELLAVCACA